MAERSLRSPEQVALVSVDELVELAGTGEREGAAGDTRAVAPLYVLTGPGGELELRDGDRNERAVVAFTDYALLVVSAGAGQPYARLSPAELRALTQPLGQAVVVLDAWLPEGHRYPDPDSRKVGDLDEFKELPADGPVWLPTRPVRRGDKRVTVELHAAEGRRPLKPLLCVYTTRQALQRCCGPYQAGAAVPVEAVRGIADEAGAHGMALNPELADEARHTDVVIDPTRSSSYF